MNKQVKQKKKSKKYKDETMSSTLNLVAEIGNYIAVIATAVVTLSLSLFIDLIDSTCSLLRSSFATGISKKLQKNLKFKYNYGTEKVEALITLLCDSLLVLGTTAVFGFSIYRLIVPGVLSKNLLVGIIFKVLCVVGDLGIMFIDFKVYKKNHTKVSKSNFEGSISALAFDGGVLLSVLLTYLLASWAGAIYLEPVSAIIISIFVIVRAVIRIKTYVKELTDETLSEEDQRKIDIILAKHFSLYNEFYSADSHKLGDTVCLDLRLSFKDETTFLEMKKCLEEFTKEFEDSFKKCNVSLIIDRY